MNAGKQKSWILTGWNKKVPILKGRLVQTLKLSKPSLRLVVKIGGAELINIMVQNKPYLNSVSLLDNIIIL